MKNKMLLILVAIVILFVGLIVVNNMKNKKAVSENNLYGEETLHQETIDQLNDPLYDNIILPEELDEKLENGEVVTVHYYRPTCVYCQRTKPMIVPMVEELAVDLWKMSLLES